MSRTEDVKKVLEEYGDWLSVKETTDLLQGKWSQAQVGTALSAMSSESKSKARWRVAERKYPEVTRGDDLEQKYRILAEKVYVPARLPDFFDHPLNDEKKYNAPSKKPTADVVVDKPRMPEMMDMLTLGKAVDALMGELKAKVQDLADEVSVLQAVNASMEREFKLKEIDYLKRLADLNAKLKDRGVENSHFSFAEVARFKEDGNGKDSVEKNVHKPADAS